MSIREEEVDVGSYVRSARDAVAERVALPAGYSLRWSGRWEYMERARRRLALVVPLTILMPLALLVFVAAASWWSYYLGRRQALESVRREAINDATWTASRFESIFERALRRGDSVRFRKTWRRWRRIAKSP